MALATQCPHCQTIFRVAHDQLKLRAGLVRCGSCKQIFNGIENLLRPEEMAQSPSALGPKPVRGASPSTVEEPLASPPAGEALPQQPSVMENPGKQVASKVDFEDDAAHGTPEQDSPSPSAASEAQPACDPLLRMTLMDVSHAHAGPSSPSPETQSAPAAPVAESDGIEQAIDDLENKPWRRTADETVADGDALDRAEAADYVEPAFVRQARRRQRFARAMRIGMGAGSLILLVVFLVEGAYVFRNQIAAWAPQAAPHLAKACAYLGCTVGLPTQIESVSIESNELQTLSAEANTFSLSVLLRNHGSTAQAWPSIELTLNDAGDKALVRRVFSPGEYLPATIDPGKGMAAGTEQSVKVNFELTQLKASGYRVYLFYP